VDGGRFCPQRGRGSQPGRFSPGRRYAEGFSPEGAVEGVVNLFLRLRSFPASLQEALVFACSPRAEAVGGLAFPR